MEAAAQNKLDSEEWSVACVPSLYVATDEEVDQRTQSGKAMWRRCGQ